MYSCCTVLFFCCYNIMIEKYFCFAEYMYCVMEIRVIVYALVSFLTFFYTLFTCFQFCIFLSSNQSGLVDGKLSSFEG